MPADRSGNAIPRGRFEDVAAPLEALAPPFRGRRPVLA